jgi:hypothetical protein
MNDGFKLRFESNKVVLSRYGTFVGKAMNAEACSVSLWRTSVIML